jgi:type IV pilus assembly protein PilV
MKRNQHGMTFIEVLVALFIIVTGILGAVAMQASAKKASFDAMQRSLASSLTQDIIERMRNNDFTALASYAGTYGDGTSPAQVCDQNNFCNAAQLAVSDLNEWDQSLFGSNVSNNAGGLNKATGCIAVAGNQVDVTISWEGREKTSVGGAVDCGTSNSKRRQVSVRVFIY